MAESFSFTTVPFDGTSGWLLYFHLYPLDSGRPSGRLVHGHEGSGEPDVALRGLERLGRLRQKLLDDPLPGEADDAFVGARPSRYQPIAIFSEMASAWKSTTMTFTSGATRASSSSATRNGESACAGMKT